jgi:hypothetical protein
MDSGLDKRELTFIRFKKVLRIVLQVCMKLRSLGEIKGSSSQDECCKNPTHWNRSDLCVSIKYHKLGSFSDISLEHKISLGLRVKKKLHRYADKIIF